jgi:hypothetical protein
MAKLPRRDVIERQLVVVQETFEAIDDDFLESLRGGELSMRYGAPPRVRPMDPNLAAQNDPGYADRVRVNAEFLRAKARWRAQ